MTQSPNDAQSPPVLAEADRNCWKIGRADRAAIIIDACDYFRIVRRAMLEAERRILIIGWDFDTRIDLDPTNDAVDDLGHFMLDLAKRNPSLEIRILKWDFGALKSLFRGTHLWMLFRWWMTKSIRFKFDGKHPPGCSHHQKIVVIDDRLAICGGIDLTHDRWDTRDHEEGDPRRIEPSGKEYCPWHDATAMIDGEAARLLGELCRDRWLVATGETMEPIHDAGPRWIDDVDPDFRNIDVAVARTRAEYEECAEIREIEQLYCDMISRAENFIYSENQYFTSPKIAAAISERLAERPELEIVMIQPKTADGWIEQMAMDGTRVRLTQMIGKNDPTNRFRIYYPVTDGGTPIYVHAKVMIVDDAMLRIGSSNLNNRSLGLDSECDLLFEVVQAEDPGKTRTAIRQIREGLLAEHLGCSASEWCDAAQAAGSINGAIEALQGSGKTVELLPMEEPEGFEEFIADKQLLDPECADEFFEPFQKTSLVSSFVANLRGRAKRFRR